MRIAVVLGLFLLTNIVNAQTQPISPDSISAPIQSKDSTFFDMGKKKDEKEEIEVTIHDYRIINSVRDTTIIDTTLSLQKEYRFNVLKKDQFELMSFSNIGQQYNQLGRGYDFIRTVPALGAAAKNINFLEHEDIKYYSVPTPTSTMFWKTVFDQGQFLDALLTFNPSERLNFSLSYNGYRSRGHYKYEQTTGGKFRATFNYRTKDDKYVARGYQAVQRIEAEENGGLSNKEEQFESGLDDFQDRSRIDVYHTDANTNLSGRLYNLEHKYFILGKSKDSVKTTNSGLAVTNRIAYETKFFQYNQQAVAQFDGLNLYGAAFPSLSRSGAVTDKAHLKNFQANVGLRYEHPVLGDTEVSYVHNDINYFFQNTLITDAGVIPSRLSTQESMVQATYQNQITDSLNIRLNAGVSMGGELIESVFDGRLHYQPNKWFDVEASYNGGKYQPSFNKLIYQSDYQNFNWNNIGQFQIQENHSFGARLGIKYLGNLKANFITLNKHVYFGTVVPEAEEGVLVDPNSAFVRPIQEDVFIRYYKLAWQNELKWRKWALEYQVQYQEVEQFRQVLNVPEWLGRASFCF